MIYYSQTQPKQLLVTTAKMYPCNLFSSVSLFCLKQMYLSQPWGTDDSLVKKFINVTRLISDWSGPDFIQLLKHKKVAKHNKIVLTRIMLQAKRPLHVYIFWPVVCLFMLSIKLLSTIFCTVFWLWFDPTYISIKMAIMMVQFQKRWLFFTNRSKYTTGYFFNLT